MGQTERRTKEERRAAKRAYRLQHPRPKGSTSKSRRYHGYIRSPKWFQRRAKYFLTHPAVCAGCGGMEKIHLHHRTYERLTKEIDSDFEVLCEDCHELVHEWHGHAGGKLWIATDEAIQIIAERGASALRDLIRH